MREYLHGKKLEITALSLFVGCVAMIWSSGSWKDHYPSLIAALFCLAATIGPEEMSQWTGSYGWTTKTYRNPHVGGLKTICFGGLVLITILLARRTL